MSIFAPIIFEPGRSGEKVRKRRTVTIKKQLTSINIKPYLK
jgi:hypothetical protein